MHERLLTVESIVVVRWHAFTIEGVERVLSAVNAAAGRGAPIYVSIVGSDVAVPAAEVRKRLLDATDDVRRVCSSVNLVLDGQGLAFAAIRSIAATMFLAKGDRHMKMFASLDDVLRERAADRLDVVLAAARTAGIVA
jgi:hypothetical protein